MTRTALPAALLLALLGCAPSADTARPAQQAPATRPAPTPPEQPAPAAKRPESPQKFADLRSLMQAKREHESRREAAASRPSRPARLGDARAGIQARALDSAAAEKTDADLRAVADLPAIRERCRQRFSTDTFDDNTLDRLSDWLCTTAGLRADEVERMPLSEVADRLDAAAGKP